MKIGLLLLLASVMLVASLWFFYESGDLLTARRYLAGLLYVLVGASTTRAGVELARLAAALHVRGG